MIVYKFVDLVGGELVSRYNSSFVYSLGETSEAEFTNKYSGIYCFNKAGVKKVSRFTEEYYVLLECFAKEEDLIRIDDVVYVFKAVKPLRVVEKAEYSKW